MLAILSYMCISTLSLALYLYTAELYPTRVRALGTSTGTAWLRLASIIGPQVCRQHRRRAAASATRSWCSGSSRSWRSVVVALFAIETKSRVLEEISP